MVAKLEFYDADRVLDHNGTARLDQEICAATDTLCAVYVAEEDRFPVKCRVSGAQRFSSKRYATQISSIFKFMSCMAWFFCCCDSIPHKILKIMTQFKQDVVKLNQSWGVGLGLGLGLEG